MTRFDGPLAPVAARATEAQEHHRLGMAELAPVGLSEIWLLKRLGDIHWRLIADAMGLPGVAFRADDGRPVYAAFCAVSVRAPGLGRAALGDTMALTSSLHVASRARLGSVHHLAVGPVALGSVVMLSTFIAHGCAGDNRSVARVRLRDLPALSRDERVDSLQHMAARSLKTAPDTGAGHTTQHHFQPCPAVDFNAAGLMYFPSFVAFADRAAFARHGGALADYVTIRRDILYTGNVDVGEPLAVSLTAQHGPASMLRDATMIARTDGAVICRIATRRRRVKQ